MGRITFLGTGDPLNDERAQTSLAVPLAGGRAGDETLLIDTSSGTVLLRQLRAAGIALDGIRHLCISHRHFDHVGGLVPLLVALVPLSAARITVSAPPETLDALRALLHLTIPGVEDWLGARLRWRTLAPERPVRVGDVTVTPFAVDHGIECVGFLLEQAGRRAVFSADTRPCPQLAARARDAALLIHEAYSLRVAGEEAHRFGHSSAADAGRAAREAGVGTLVLTHLRASRFADPVTLRAEAAAAFGGPVTVAEDLATIEF